MRTQDRPLRLEQPRYRCGGLHEVMCCHASRHNKCDRCVHEQWVARAEAIRREEWRP